jgi:hypothetical protein
MPAPRSVVEKARNDLSAAVPKFSLSLEEHRRTPDGRVRTSQEFLTAFFPHDEKSCTDRILKHLPNEVRGPIIAAWGVRGIKSALRDNDEKVQSVVHDALVAGDIDHTAFEDGLGAETLVRWVPLGELWAFWRGGKLTKQAIQKALTVAYDLALFDARWFLDTVQAKSGALKGTDVLADGLSKEDLVAWIKRIHEGGDGTPKGLVAALGWEKIAAKTRDEALIAVLDAVVTKVGLVPPKEAAPPASKQDVGEKAEMKTDPHAMAVDASKAPKPPGSSDKLPVDGGWSMRPNPLTGTLPADTVESVSIPMSTEEAINIVLEDELIMPESNAPSPNPPSTGGGKHVQKDPFPPRPSGKN